MNLRLLTTSLVATTLLFSTLGCSKKNDPAIDPVGTGSYKLDGILRTCEAKTFASTTKAQSGWQNYDYLEVELTTTPQPASGAERLELLFYKLTGQPNTAYQLVDIDLYTNNGVFAGMFTNEVTTITPATNGGFSGTFSAKVSPPPAGTVPPIYSLITDGIFANAQP